MTIGIADPSKLLEDLLRQRKMIHVEINKRVPPRRGQARRLEIVDRECTFEVNLAEVESSSLLESLDAIAIELRTRGEMFGPLIIEFANASDDALAASMRDLNDAQISLLIGQAAAIERLAEIAHRVQLERLEVGGAA